MTDISRFGFSSDTKFVEFLIREIGVAAVPGSSFYSNPADGAQQVRFAFCKKPETLEEAGRRLRRLRNRLLSEVDQLPRRGFDQFPSGLIDEAWH